MKNDVKQIAEAVYQLLQADQLPSRVAKSLAAYLATEHRTRDVASIVRRLKHMNEVVTGRVELTATSAHPLSAQTLNQLTAKLSEALDKPIDLDATISPSVGAGVLVENDTVRLDLTTARKLQQLTRSTA